MILYLEDIFTHHYGLKYLPTMVQPSYINQDNTREKLYYSLEIPTLMELPPKSNRNRNKLEDLRELKHILNHILPDISGDIINRPLILDYYHNDFDRFGEIKKTETLILTDDKIKSEIEKNIDKSFCKTSLFFRGCISLFLGDDCND